MTQLQLQILQLCSTRRLKRREIQAELMTPFFLKDSITSLYISGHLGGTRGMHSTTNKGLALLREALI